MKDFAEENLSKSRKKGSSGSEPAPSIEEEVDCMKNICECLYDCLSNIRRFLNQASKELSMESIDQALECFQLAVTLLSSDPEPERLKALVFDNALEKEEEYTFISLLLDFVSVPPFTKSNTYIESSKEGGYQLQIANETDQLLNHLKIYALKCLSKFVSICSYESRNMYEQTVDDQRLKTLSKMCAEAIADEHGIDILMEFLFENEKDGVPNSGNEEVRLAVAECLFFFVVRNEVGRLALLLQKGICQLLKCLENDTNALVRSYCCAILREFSNHYPDELLKENTIQVCIKVLNMDSSQEVRALSAEIIEIIFKSDPKATQFVSVPTLCKVLNDRLTKDSSRDVLEAVCKLLETLFSSKIAESSDGRKDLFFDVHREFISKGYWKSFIRVLKQCTVRPASLAVRALRYLLQTSPSEERLSRLIVGHFQTLSVLLKSSLEQNKTNGKQKQQNSTMIAHKLLKVELSIVLALLFLHSPQSRKQVHTELTAFPLWMSTLRGALLKHLSYAEPEYFSDIRAVDEKGVNIYAEFKALGKGSLQNSILKEIFSSQEQDSEGSDIYSDLHSEFMDDDDKTKGKINHFILCFAIHETLSENPITSSPVKDMSSPSKDSHNEPPYLSLDAEMTPRPKNSPEKSNQILADTEDSFINQFGDVMTKEQEVIEIESIDSKSDSSSLRGQADSPQRENKGRPNENFSPILVDSPMKNHSTNSSVVGSIASARSIVSRSSISVSIQKRQFENTVYLCKKLGQWYESKDMRIKKLKAQDNFVKAHRLAANSTGSRIIPTGYVNTPDGLVLRYKPNESPQKLSKSWSDEDIKTTDVFTFEIPFDDFTIERVERILSSLGKHIKYIKKSLVICPKAPNAKGRRTFLMDLNINILPKTQMILEELLIMMKEYGIENIKMPIYLWKGKERKDTALSQYNILEIMEFVKIHLANYFQGELERLDTIRFNNSIADSMTKQEM